jgi:hypothetical protein
MVCRNVSTLAFLDPCRTERLAKSTCEERTRVSICGSIKRCGCDFQPFRISLEMVAQICPRWNRVADWLREAERFSAAA